MRTIFLLSGLTLLVGCDDKASDTASTDDARPNSGSVELAAPPTARTNATWLIPFPAETVDATRWDFGADRRRILSRQRNLDRTRHSVHCDWDGLRLQRTPLPPLKPGLM